jgi:hypothetical protein
MLVAKKSLTLCSRTESQVKANAKEGISVVSTQSSLSVNAPESVPSEGINDMFGTALGIANELCKSSTQYNKHRQDQDLMGTSSGTLHDSLSSDQVDKFLEATKTASQDCVSTCPIHNSVLSNAEKMPGQGPQLKHLPIDRYLAEGLEERYTLLKLDDEAQWARYSGCICVK